MRGVGILGGRIPKPDTWTYRQNENDPKDYGYQLSEKDVHKGSYTKPTTGTALHRSYTWKKKIPKPPVLTIYSN